MKDYVEKALQFIESAEMRDYLRTCPDRSWSSGDGCAAIVRNAPVSLERKIPVMDLIAEQTGSAEAVKFAKAARFALNERIANHTSKTSIWANHHYFSGSNGIIRHMQDTRNDFLENHLVNPLATYGNTLQYVMEMPREGSDWYSIGITNYDPNIHFMPKECKDCDEDTVMKI